MSCSSGSFALAASIILSATVAHAADHAVRPTGDCSVDGDGSAWSCAASAGAAGARRGFPASGTLVRGDTYFIADGSYGALDIQQDVQGTTWITMAPPGPPRPSQSSISTSQPTPTMVPKPKAKCSRLEVVRCSVGPAPSCRGEAISRPRCGERGPLSTPPRSAGAGAEVSAAGPACCCRR